MTAFKPREPTLLDKSTDLENSTEPHKSAESAVEEEIREFVRRDVAPLRRTPEADSEVVANDIMTLLQRVAGFSVAEIDRLMSELQTLRDLLHSEGARVQREIAGYAHLSQSAMQSTKIITESLAMWKNKNAQRAGLRMTAILLLGAGSLAQANEPTDTEYGGEIKVGPLGQVFSSGPVDRGRNTYGFVAPLHGKQAPGQAHEAHRAA